MRCFVVSGHAVITAQPKTFVSRRLQISINSARYLVWASTTQSVELAADVAVNSFNKYFVATAPTVIPHSTHPCVRHHVLVKSVSVRQQTRSYALPPQPLPLQAYAATDRLVISGTRAWFMDIRGSFLGCSGLANASSPPLSLIHI